MCYIVLIVQTKAIAFVTCFGWASHLKIEISRFTSFITWQPSSSTNEIFQDLHTRNQASRGKKKKEPLWKEKYENDYVTMRTWYGFMSE